MGHLLHGVRGGAVDEGDVAAARQRVTHEAGKLGDLSKDTPAEFFSHVTQTLESPSLECVAGLQPVRLQQREGAIADALNADRVQLGQAPPRLERCRAGKTDVPGDQHAVVSAALRRGQNGAQGISVPVNVGETQKPHFTP